MIEKLIKKISITEKETKDLHFLWMIYGNSGKKHTHGNHRFIQDILERGEFDTESFTSSVYQERKQAITEECYEAVIKILNRSGDGH